jgi:hypothetical protein
LKKYERERARSSFDIFLGARDTARVYDGTIRTVNGLIGEDNVLVRKDHIDRLDVASD